MKFKNYNLNKKLIKKIQKSGKKFLKYNKF